MIHETLSECITALVTAGIAAILRAIEKRRLKKKGLLKEESPEDDKGKN